MKCENCIKSDVCKHYPTDGIPPITRQNVLKKLNKECQSYVSNYCKLSCRCGECIHSLWSEQSGYDEFVGCTIGLTKESVTIMKAR